VARARPDQPRREIRDNLKSLRGIYIDCGWRDQYHNPIRIAHPVRAPRRGRNPAPLRGIPTTTTPTSITAWIAACPFLYRALKP